MMEKVKITQVKPNDSNPRYIKDIKFEKLVESVKQFPEMLQARPIVVNKGMVVLGGNMRLRACQEAGLKEVFIKVVDWSEEKQKEFIIKDNVSFGEWDWDVLANEWENTELNEWGMDVWEDTDEIDYSILDEADDIDDKIKELSKNNKKALLIEFDVQDFEEAYNLVKFFREQGELSKTILNMLRSEKQRRNV